MPSEGVTAPNSVVWEEFSRRWHFNCNYGRKGGGHVDVSRREDSQWPGPNKRAPGGVTGACGSRRAAEPHTERPRPAHMAASPLCSLFDVGLRD